MPTWTWFVIGIVIGTLSVFGWGRFLKAGTEYDLRLEIARLQKELALRGAWNKGMSEDVDTCWREREKLEATLKAMRAREEAEAIDTLKHFGVPEDKVMP